MHQSTGSQCRADNTIRKENNRHWNPAGVSLYTPWITPSSLNVTLVAGSYVIVTMHPPKAKLHQAMVIKASPCRSAD